MALQGAAVMSTAARLGTLSLLLVGCTGASDGTGLAFKELRLDEDSVPLPFVVAIENTSDEAIEVQDVAVNVTSKTLISPSKDADRIPDGFNFEVEQSDDHPTQVEPGEVGAACGFLRWTLPTDPPPMIAVITCDFRVHTNDETLTTEAITLVLQSRPGFLRGASEVPEHAHPMASEQAKRTLAVLAKLPGDKSAGFAKLVRQLNDERSSRNQAP